MTRCHIAEEGKCQLHRCKYLQTQRALRRLTLPDGLRIDQPVDEWTVRESNVITNWGILDPVELRQKI